MTTSRIYRVKQSKKEVVKEIIECAEKQFDPNLAKIFVTKVIKKSLHF